MLQLQDDGSVVIRNSQSEEACVIVHPDGRIVIRGTSLVTGPGVKLCESSSDHPQA